MKRLELHDLVNAVLLAVVLAVAGYFMLQWLGSAGAIWDEGFFDSEKVDTIDDEELAERAAEVDVVGSRPANEVSVIVGNGSDGRDGLAGRASERLATIGYGMIAPVNKEGDPVDDSSVYYADGFRLDAVRVALLLGFEEDNVQPLLARNPGVPTDGADVIVVLGNNAPL